MRPRRISLIDDRTRINDLSDLFLDNRARSLHCPFPRPKKEINFNVNSSSVVQVSGDNFKIKAAKGGTRATSSSSQRCLLHSTCYPLAPGTIRCIPARPVVATSAFSAPDDVANLERKYDF